MKDRETLTPKQAEVLTLVASGHSNSEIAVLVGCRATTVRTHVQTILTKLHVHSRAEAVALALHKGFIVYDPDREAE